MIITISIFLFAMFDYWGYNLSVKRGWVNSNFINPYRIVQGLFQIVLTALLFFLFSWVEALSFFLLWWVWCADWIYYLYCFLFNYNDTRRHWLQAFDGIVQWGWWTPFGLVKWLVTRNQMTVISGIILAVQSLMGIIITVLLNLNF